jgi:hypothetical protein
MSSAKIHRESFIHVLYGRRKGCKWAALLAGAYGLRVVKPSSAIALIAGRAEEIYGERGG